MTIEASVVADSVSYEGDRITTLQLKYPRFIHSELLTHRVFSRNASSSRAIPVKKMLAEVWNRPATPIHWGKNMAGMQAREELGAMRMGISKLLWRWSGRGMCAVVWLMDKVGLHKQVANRLLEPWQHIHVVVTATDWENFFALRCHPDAQPEFQDLALKMRSAMESSIPVKRAVGDWHLPYVTTSEREELPLKFAIEVSVARCCRVSYLNHGGSVSKVGEDLRLYDRLVSATPPHMSPTEHQATPGLWDMRYANFMGWQSHRWVLENPICHAPHALQNR